MSKSLSVTEREEFEIFRHRTFLNWASLSPAPAAAARAVASMAEQAGSFRDGDLNTNWKKLSSGVREEAAALLSCGSGNIAITGSTTHGIQLALEAISPAKGENVVTTDLEFPSTGAVLQKWKEKGVEIRVVASQHGTYGIGDLQTLVDRSTRAVVMSSVIWVNGFRPDAAEISKVAHEAGAYFVVDAVQHMGAMRFDAGGIAPDFAAAGGQKWMTSPFGAALLYVSGRATDELDPPHYSLDRTPEPEGGWNEYFAREDKMPFTTYTPVHEARNMECGGWQNHAGMVCLKESLKLLNRVGTEEVEARIVGLTRLLREELEGLGAEVLSPADGKHMSSITTFRISDDWREHVRLVERLSSAGINVSCRGGSGMGGIRVSVHHVNNEDDIMKLTGAIRSITRK